MITQTINHQSHRRRAGALAIVTLVTALLASACEPEAPKLAQAPAPAPGAVNPQVWIEFPFEGQTLPMGPVTLVAYAADPTNVVQIDLRVNGQAVPAGPPRGIDANNGYRLARLDFTWQPLAQGQYLLEARARNSAGTYGLPTTVKFCVGSCQPITPTWTPTPAARRFTDTPTPTPVTPTRTHTPITAVAPPPPPITPTRTHTPITAVAPPPPASINFRSDAPYVNGGSCTTLRWDVDNVRAVALDGQGVVGHSSRQVCPCQQTTYTLNRLCVIHPLALRQVADRPF